MFQLILHLFPVKAPYRLTITLSYSHNVNKGGGLVFIIVAVVVLAVCSLFPLGLPIYYRIPGRFKTLGSTCALAYC